MTDYFPGQHPNERVEMVVRPFWLVVLPVILLGILLVVIPVIVLAALSATEVDLTIEPARNYLATLVPAWYIALTTWAYFRWLDWYLDITIITPERLIDMDQNGMFNRQIAELELPNIQDVSAQRVGLLQTFFDFGNVLVQTAGEMDNFELTGVRHPNEVARKITDLKGGHSKQMGEDIAGHMMDAAERMREVAEEMEQQTQGDAISGQENGQQAKPGVDQQPKQEQTSTPAPKPPPTPPQPQESGGGPPSTPPRNQGDDNQLPREFER